MGSSLVARGACLDDLPRAAQVRWRAERDPACRSDRTPRTLATEPRGVIAHALPPEDHITDPAAEYDARDAIPPGRPDGVRQVDSLIASLGPEGPRPVRNRAHAVAHEPRRRDRQRHGAGPVPAEATRGTGGRPRCATRRSRRSTSNLGQPVRQVGTDIGLPSSAARVRVSSGRPRSCRADRRCMSLCDDERGCGTTRGVSESGR